MPRPRSQKQTPEASSPAPVPEAQSAVQLSDPASEVAPPPPTLSPEAEILARAQAGDHHAFSLFFFKQKTAYEILA